MPKLLAKYAAENPFPAYKAFLLDTVVANPQIWAHPRRWAKSRSASASRSAFSPCSGCCSDSFRWPRTASPRSTSSSGQQGFHIMLFAMMLAFLIARAGRVWGVDGWVRRHAPNSLLARVPLG